MKSVSEINGWINIFNTGSKMNILIKNTILLNSFVKIMIGLYNKQSIYFRVKEFE